MREAKIVHEEEVPFSKVEGVNGVRFKVLIGEDDAPNYVMRIFEIDPGKGIPEHSHPWEHEEYVLDGRLIIKIGGQSYSAGKGCSVFIPPGAPHSYQNVGEGKAVFICIIPREGMCLRQASRQ